MVVAKYVWEEALAMAIEKYLWTYLPGTIEGMVKIKVRNVVSHLTFWIM